MNIRKLILFLAVLLSIGINVYFRLNSFNLTEVKHSVNKEAYAFIASNLGNKLPELYPGLNKAEYASLNLALLNQALAQKKIEVTNSTSKRIAESRSYFQDESGWPYLLEIDPYRWLRRIDNYLKSGHFGTSTRGGRDYDDLMQAPLGYKVEPIKLHYLAGAYFYKLMHFFDNKITLMNALGLYPVFLCAILVIAVFYAALLFGISILGSFVISLVLGISPIVLLRSSFGWFDTDLYTLIMPLFIISSLGLGLRFKKNSLLGYVALAGLLNGIYSSLWATWWLSFYIILGGFFAYSTVEWFKSKHRGPGQRIFEPILALCAFAFFSYLAVLLISGPGAVKASIYDAFSDLILRGKTPLDNFWPNLVFSIEELLPSNPQFMAYATGGAIVGIAAILGLFLSLFDKKTWLQEDKKFIVIVLAFWMIVTVILAFIARRFTLFLMLPVAFFFGSFLEKTAGFVISLHSKKFFIGKIRYSIFVFAAKAIFIVAATLPLYAAFTVNLLPAMNDTWQAILTKIQKDTPANAIIDAWWDQGDFIMSIAGRATLHDAGWQYTPVPYWFSRALLSNNEKEAYGILRMLNAGSYKAFDELRQALNMDKLATLEVLNKLILLDKSEGAQLLNSYIKDASLKNKILQLIYEPRPAYLLVYNNMVSYCKVMSRVANWDFKKLDLWHKFQKSNKADFIEYAQKRLGLTKESAETAYAVLQVVDKKNISSWISGEPLMFYTSLAETPIPERDEKMVSFNNGLIIDRQALKAYYWDSAEQRYSNVGLLVFVNKDSVSENVNPHGDNGFAAIMIEKEGSYKSALFSKQLAQSLFFKLFFLEARGLKNFKLIAHEWKKAHSNVYLYEITPGNPASANQP